MSNPSVSNIVALAQSRPPRLGATRLILVDGPAGSGKTTLAARLGEVLEAQVLHGDDIYEGWHGLGTMWPVLGEQILEPLARGVDGVFRRWDWEAHARAETIEVPAAPWLVIEGVGVAQRGARPYASLVVYVEAPWELRLARGIERDGEQMRGEWEQWQAEEETFLAAESTREAADIVLDGTTRAEQLGRAMLDAHHAQLDDSEVRRSFIVAQGSGWTYVLFTMAKFLADENLLTQSEAQDVLDLASRGSSSFSRDTASRLRQYLDSF